MTFSPSLIKEVRQQLRSPADQPTPPVNEDKEEASTRARRIINAIPALIADAILHGARSARVMLLQPERDLLDVNWRVRWLGCNEDRLCGAALSVYGWCELNGLDPHLRPVILRQPSQLHIRWDKRVEDEDLKLGQTLLGAIWAIEEKKLRDREANS